MYIVDLEFHGRDILLPADEVINYTMGTDCKEHGVWFFRSLI